MRRAMARELASFDFVERDREFIGWFSTQA
jgi:hypothetical protein